MKYLHLTEEDVIYQLPFAKGLQYQHSIICMEGGECYYIATPEELSERKDIINKILTQDIELDLE